MKVFNVLEPTPLSKEVALIQLRKLRNKILECRTDMGDSFGDGWSDVDKDMFNQFEKVLSETERRARWLIDRIKKETKQGK